jgi:hypothetical protein
MAIGAEFHVAADGSDANDGSAKKPFATVCRAVEALRGVRASASNEPVRVVIGPGTFELAAPIELADRDTTAPVQFVGAGRDQTILSGGRTIAPSAWQIGSDGRSWRTTIPEVLNGAWQVEQVYVGDRRALRPSLPRDSYFIAEGKPADSPKPIPDRFVAEKGDLDRCECDLTNGVELVAMHGWNITRTHIKAFDAESREVTLATGRGGWMRDFDHKSYYRLENVRSAYGEVEGEWFCDHKTGVLSYLPLRGETPETTRFVVPVLTNLVSVLGDRASGRRAANVSFAGICFSHVAEPLREPGTTYHQGSLEAGAAIRIDYAENVVVESCAVRHTGGWGVKIEGGCIGCSVVRSAFFDLGAGGVALGQKWIKRDDDARYTRKCRVEQCLIEGGGRIQPGSVGICVAMSGDNLIAHNTVRDFYYSGISVGYDWSDKNDAAGGNIVEWNHIYNLGQGVLSDLGGIYTLGRQPGTVLRCNFIHDVQTARYGAQGIYMDEGSSEITACSNIIVRAHEAAFSVAPKARGGIRLENNVFLYPSHYVIWTFNDKQNGCDVNVARNIFVWDKKLKEIFPEGGPAKEWHFSSNVWWCASGPASAQGDSDIAADPRLEMPCGHEMRLRLLPDSPAIQLGFVPFDLSEGVGHEPLAMADAKCSSGFATRTFPVAPPPRKRRK